MYKFRRKRHELPVYNQPLKEFDKIGFGSSINPVDVELLTLREAATQSGFSVPYLRTTAQRGRLWAVKKDGVWFTTLKAVEEYKQSRLQIRRNI